MYHRPYRDVRRSQLTPGCEPDPGKRIDPRPSVAQQIAMRMADPRFKAALKDAEEGRRADRQEMNENHRYILELVEQNPGLTAHEAAQIVGKRTILVRNTLEKLATKGLVVFGDPVPRGGMRDGKRAMARTYWRSDEDQW
jgi:hypothetical protein